jgi:hypothetical protein
VVEFAVPTAASAPANIALGSDGRLWFTEKNANQIGAMTQAGVFTEYAAAAQPFDIAPMSSGNLVYTTPNSANEISTAGALVSSACCDPSPITGVTAGPLNTVWFLDSFTAYRSTFPLPAMCAGCAFYPIPTPGTQPQHITLGADGNMWFSEYGNSAIAKVEASADLTVTINGLGATPGGGTVSDGASFFCGPGSGSICTQSMPEGASITLTATPSAGSRFSSWTGGPCDGSTVAVCTFAFNGATSMTANFMKTWTLTVWNDDFSYGGAPWGTSSVSDGVNTCGSFPANLCYWTYDDGTSVTLTGTPNPGSRFWVWGYSYGGECYGSQSPTCTFTMDQDRLAESGFMKTWNLALTITGGPAGNGSGQVDDGPADHQYWDSPKPNANVCGPSSSVTCNFVYDGNGWSWTLTATPSAGSRFNGWGGDCAFAGLTPTCALTYNGDHTATADFMAQWDLDVTVNNSAGSNGSVTSDVGGIDCPSVLCSQTYDDGTVVTLTENAPAGTTFTGWSGAGCSGTGATCVVTMDAAKSVVADFTANWDLGVTVVNNGVAAGSVTSDVGGIDCPGVLCTANYVNGTVVTLTAVEPAGTMFTGWSGDCSGTALTCVVTMDAAKSVTATFSPGWALDVTVVNNGSTPASGSVTSDVGVIACPGVCSDVYLDGTVVTLTANAPAGTRFVSWSGDCAGTTPTCALTMSAAHAATATFVKIWNLAVTKSGTGSGTVADAPGNPPPFITGINCGATCSVTVDDGTGLYLQATPDPTSTFTGWSAIHVVGGVAPGDRVCSPIPNFAFCGPDTINGDTSVNADFARITHVLTVSKTGTGGGVVSSNPSGISCGATCSHAFDDGAVVTLSATPNPTSTFTGWSGDCAGTGACVVTMDAARNVTASFTEVSYAINVSKAGAGLGLVTSSPAGITCGATCSANFLQSTVVTLTATPDAASSFAGWSGACSGTGSCILAMDATKNVTATFNGPGYQPDGLIRIKGGVSYIGDNIYNTTAAGQTSLTVVDPGKKATFNIMVQNDGNPLPDSFRILGQGGSASVSVRYYDGAGEITAAVLAGTYTTPVLDSELGPSTGQPKEFVIKVVMMGSSGAKRGSLVTISSVADPTKLDAVKARVKVS